MRKQVLTADERRFKPLLFETIQHNPFLLPLLRCMNIICISTARQGDTRFSFHGEALWITKTWNAWSNLFPAVALQPSPPYRTSGIFHENSLGNKTLVHLFSSLLPHKLKETATPTSVSDNRENHNGRETARRGTMVGRQQSPW